MGQGRWQSVEQRGAAGERLGTLNTEQTMAFDRMSSPRRKGACTTLGIASPAQA